MTITIYEIFELNRVLHSLISQQSSYTIQTAFKIHTLIKWLDETEQFIIERMHIVFGTDVIDSDNPLYLAFLSSQIPFTDSSLTIKELLETTDDVKISVNDVEILEKIFDKAEN